MAKAKISTKFSERGNTTPIRKINEMFSNSAKPSIPAKYIGKSFDSLQ